MNAINKKRLLYKAIMQKAKRVASELFKERRVSFLEASRFTRLTLSEMIRVLIKNDVKFGSEELMSSEIGLKNLRQYFG